MFTFYHFLNLIYLATFKDNTHICILDIFDIFSVWEVCIHNKCVNITLFSM